jgi:antitoxin (DNA-binding transcriptional repressor) of toxin-antitoxin stability system
MTTATIFEVKTNLSALLRKVQQGETVIITSGRKKTPVAKLEPVEPIQPKPKKRLGVMETPGFVVSDAFWEPLPPGWDGVSDPE